MRYAIGLLAFLLAGCLLGGGEDGGGSRLIGYSYGTSCTSCGKADSGGYYAWKLSRTKNSPDTFWVYADITDLNERPGFFKGKIFAALGSDRRIPILDEGAQCLNVEQTGKDTVVVDGKNVPVDVPIEPCLPYLLDKDIP